MTSSTFISYAQNREDVVLQRALSGVQQGRYVDVGANDPTEDSVSKAFYEAGWRGITVEPVHELAERQRAERPGDIVIEAAINEQEGGTVELLQIGDARLSTLVAGIGEQHERDGWEMTRVQVPSRRLDAVLRDAAWAGEDIHFLSIDTEGAEEAVLRSLDLTEFRPWVILVEATKPQSAEPSHHGWEPLLLNSGYRFTLFDGLSRFYLADEKWDELHQRLGAPASVLDRYTTFRSLERELELQRLMQATVDLNAALSGTKDERDALAAERVKAVAERDKIAADLDRTRASASERERADLDTILRWRSAALGAWSKAAVSGLGATSGISTSEELSFLRNHSHAVTTELAAMKRTVSWRVTRPLRAARRLGKLVGR